MAKFIEEEIKCDGCGWEGKESELVVDYYDAYNMSNPIAGSCPVCGAECE
jgi:hypothetical protein